MTRFVMIAALIVLPGDCARASETSLGELGQGISAYNARNFNGAISHLKAARTVISVPIMFSTTSRILSC